MEDELNLKHLLETDENVLEFSELIPFDKSNYILRFLDKCNTLGFKLFSSPLQDNELENYVRITGQKNKNIKAFYFKEMVDDDVHAEFATFIKKHLPESFQDLFFSVEIMSGRFVDWHNDISFTNERNAIHGDLIWVYDTHGQTLNVEGEEPIRLKRNHLYYLNDQVNHSLSAPKGRKRAPAKLIVLKFAKTNIFI